MHNLTVWFYLFCTIFFVYHVYLILRVKHIINSIVVVHHYCFLVVFLLFLKREFLGLVLSLETSSNLVKNEIVYIFSCSISDKFVWFFSRFFFNFWGPIRNLRKIVYEYFFDALAAYFNCVIFEFSPRLIIGTLRILRGFFRDNIFIYTYTKIQNSFDVLKQSVRK